MSSISIPAVAARVRTRPALRALGVHPLLACLLGLQAFVLVFNVLAFRETGLGFEWPGAPMQLGAIGAIYALWAYLAAYPGRNPKEWVLAETFLCFALFLQLGTLVGPAQYAAAALVRPLVDSSLAAADVWLGVSVPALAEWTRHHPAVAAALVKGYNTLLPQFFAAFVILGLVLRDREALWEFLFHFHFAAVVTLMCFAWWPAAHVYAYYGFKPVIDQTPFMTAFSALRSGTMTTVSMDTVTGLVSMPSFHTLGALIVMWAFRSRRWCLVPLVAINVVLVSATVLAGVHYVVDLLASVAVMGIGIALYHALRSRIRLGAAA